ncbi:MAG: DUF1549 domain-containing protein [Planctomycetales bacterium]|nr:DUF1549 domain-containing protein [Planctomycetales bacterium]
MFQKLEEPGLSPAPAAERAELFRWPYFGLLGLTSTPEQVQRFVSVASDGAWSALMEELLASPHYGERLGTTLAGRGAMRRLGWL